MFRSRVTFDWLPLVQGFVKAAVTCHCEGGLCVARNEAKQSSLEHHSFIAARKIASQTALAMTGRRHLRTALPLVLISWLLVFVVGCSQNMTFQMMGSQPKYLPLAPGNLFPNGQSAQPPVADTVARGHLQDDTARYTGKDGNAAVTTFPYTVTKDVLLRGEERFNIFCAPCHGRTGVGNGLIVQRGFSAPPTFHQDRLRNAPVGHFFDVITNGYGVMPSYAEQIPVNDRWAIIAYIRSLQLSQHATINDVPPDERSKLGGK